MKRIFKYIIDPHNLDGYNELKLQLPKTAKVLSSKKQLDKLLHENIVIYALIDDEEKETKEIIVKVIGTGHNIHDRTVGGVNIYQVVHTIDDFELIDTVMLENGNLVFHVFIKE